MKNCVHKMSVFQVKLHFIVSRCFLLISFFGIGYALQAQTAQESFDEGNEAFWSGQYTNALINYNKAISIDTSQAVYYLHRANTYFQMRKYPKAISDYTIAITKDPYNPKSYNMRGRARYLLKDYDGAVKDYDMATALKKEKGKNSLKGWEYATSGSEALACINWIEQLKKGYDNHLDINAMREWATEALSSDTLTADMQVLSTEVVAMTYYSQEEYDQALEYLRKADAIIAGLPFGSAYTAKYLEELDFNLYYVYAGILLHQKNYTESIAVFEKIAKWDAKNNLPFYALAQAHFYQQDLDTSLDYLQKALTLGFAWENIQLSTDFYEGLKPEPRFQKMAEQYSGQASKDYIGE